MLLGWGLVWMASLMLGVGEAIHMGLHPRGIGRDGGVGIPEA